MTAANNNRKAEQLQTHHSTRAAAAVAAETVGTAEQDFSPVLVSPCDAVLLSPFVGF